MSVLMRLLDYTFPLVMEIVWLPLFAGKLLVFPVYPAAWPQAKKSSFVRLVGKTYEKIQRHYVVKRVRCRYRQAETVAVAVLDTLMRSACFASLVKWFRNTHVAEHVGL